MVLELHTIPARDLTPARTEEIAALCGWVFDCDYRYLMDLCPLRTHVLGYDGDRLVGHALWLDRPLRVGEGPWRNTAYVEGVATHPDYRRRGYGAAVMRKLQREIEGYDFAALSPAVESWYVTLGWEKWCGPLRIERDGGVQITRGETVLIYRTPRSGPLDLGASLTAPWRPFEVW